MMYFQCTLSQGTGRTTAYIEQRGAQVGKLLEVKEDGFTGRWRVESVSDKGVDEVYLREKQRKDRHFNQDI